MVVIHTAEDIIRAMDENPEWLEAVRARVLPREVLELPRRFEELRAVVEQLAATQNQMLATQNAILAEQAEMKVKQAEMLATQNQMLATQNRILAEQAEMKAEQAEMKAEQAEIKAEQAEIKATQNQMLATQNRILAEQAEMKAEQAEIKATQNQILATQKQHTATLAHLNGGEVERLLGKQIYGMLGSYPLRMRLVRVLRGYYWTHGMDRFNGALEKANDAGKISDVQHDRLIHTDFIASMRRRESPEILYIVIEASRKINRNDVDRAVRSRAAMQVAFDGAEVLAAVYGWEISDDDRRYADSNGATVFISTPEV